MTRPTYEIVVTATEQAVTEGSYAPGEERFPLRLGAYGLLREANQQLVQLAQAEAEKRGLVLDPWSLPRHEPARWLPGDELRLIRPEHLQLPAGGRPWLASVRVKRIQERPRRWVT